MKNPKYIVYEDHKAKYNHLDSVHPIAAATIKEAMIEALCIYSNCPTLWAVSICERVPRHPNRYETIMTTHDGISFAPPSYLGGGYIRTETDTGDDYTIY